MALMEKYDAFISYSHAEDNAEIAEALHKKLEHYRIPSQIQKITGKKNVSFAIRKNCRFQQTSQKIFTQH